jgi:hypothetical protein
VRTFEVDRRCRILILAFALFAVPAPAISATVAPPPAPTPPPNQRVTYKYKTFLDPGEVDYWTIHKFDVIFGTLALTFNPDKTIRGTYRPDYSASETVSGRLMGGGRLRLHIGKQHFDGRFTPRGFAVATAPAGPGTTLWGQLMHPALKQRD